MKSRLLREAHSEPWSAEYYRRTSRSRGLYDAALKVLPGGDTRSSTFFLPYPVFMRDGAGCWLTDVDGNRYLDIVNNYTSLIHGHAHPKIVAAIVEQVGKGSCFASPHHLQTQLASILTERIPSIEQVRFCNSGTEATMAAIRVAKAFTNRHKILKMEGGYHGTHDAAQISVSPPVEEAGPAKSPLPRADCKGLFRGVLEDVLVAPFNDVEAAGDILARHAHEIAAIIVEPVMGAAGTIPADPRFLQFLRTASQEQGSLLIFDEIISFRISYGGAQEFFGVKPDLTTLGKIIGGGLPVGAFGGSADVMALFDPRKDGLPHSGTFNGNPVTMAAGIAALNLLTRNEIARVNELGAAFRAGLQELFSDCGVQAKVTGVGSLAAWHFTESEVVDYRSAASGKSPLQHPLHLSLLNRGIFATPRGSASVSTPMGKQEIQDLLDRFKTALGEVCLATEVSATS